MATSSSSSSPTSPTTFIQADTKQFQRPCPKINRFSSGPVSFTGPRRSPFKLQERRHTLRKLEIKLGLNSLGNSSSPTRRKRQVDSPVTPLCSEFLFFPSPGTESPSPPAVLLQEEESTIAEKGFCLHPSPLNTPRGSEPPELLTLFPLSSPSQSDQD
ncbi:hypothetical protein OIU78_023371 [Salix suchowensis]|nr:hypothetical protein OIU78_023371 [Salix suchowensis]